MNISKSVSRSSGLQLSLIFTVVHRVVILRATWPTYINKITFSFVFLLHLTLVAAFPSTHMYCISSSIIKHAAGVSKRGKLLAHSASTVDAQQ